MPRMPMRAAALCLCTATAAAAQELSVEMSTPLEAGLLVHTGSFAAGRSYVDSNHCPEGETRPQAAEVRFDPPFREAPQITVSLNHLDFDVLEETPRNVRVRARAENVTQEGMTLVVETWCDTNLHGASGTYLVMGQPAAASGAEASEAVPVEPEQTSSDATLEQEALDLPSEW